MKTDDARQVKFDEETIRALFGNEAAEDENSQRLKEYYVKAPIYSQMKSNIPFYLLVGHKGVGKSALLRVLHLEDSESGNIPISLQPNEVLSISTTHDVSFLNSIENWKNGLIEIILKKMLESVGKRTSKLESFATLLSGVISKFVGKAKDNIDIEEITQLFNDSFLEDKKIVVYLDDLDRGWKNSAADISNISALINAIRDLLKVMPNLHFRIALRSDVYYAIRTSDETTDKIDSSVLWQRWTNQEIFVMLVKRVETFFNRSIDEKMLLPQSQSNLAHYLDPILERKFYGSGKWNDAPMYQVLMSHIRKRPRDLVKLLTLAARSAQENNRNRILSIDLKHVLPQYSNDRLTDTINEYKCEFPQIEDLLLKMKPTRKEITKGSPCLFTRAELTTKLRNILSNSSYRTDDGRIIDESYLAAFLYKINFLTARKDQSGKIIRVYYDENQYIHNNFTDFGYAFEMHPAYRWALQPQNIDDIFEQIDLLDS